MGFLSHVNTMSIQATRRLLVEVDQLDALADLVAGGKAERLDGAGAWRTDRVLHLHRLENEQRRPLLDRRAWGGEQRDHLARHRREQAGALLVVLGAADAEQVDQRERMRAAGDED